MLAAGGNLAVDTLLQAYRRGIFPWFEKGQPILWWSPEPRMVLYPDKLHISRSMAKRLRRKDYEIRVDTAFPEVVQACAALRNTRPADTESEALEAGFSSQEEPGSHTWILPEMVSAYCRLFSAGHAHSVECWIEGELAGGLYGLAIGGVFCGESMFSRQPNTSKLALIYLARALDQAGFSLIDCQLSNPHLATLGAVEIPRKAFLDILNRDQHRNLDWPDAAIFATVVGSTI